MNYYRLHERAIPRPLLPRNADSSHFGKSHPRPKVFHRLYFLRVTDNLYRRFQTCQVGTMQGRKQVPPPQQPEPTSSADSQARDINKLSRHAGVSEAGARRRNPESNRGISAPTPSSCPDVRPKPNSATSADDINSRIRNILLASPYFPKFYADIVLHDAPNSNLAKVFRNNYSKILEKVNMAVAHQQRQHSTPTCTHIRVTGVRCGSPSLRGEQFCYFHQRMHRGVRTPPQARLHPVAMIEDEESIQAALMEVINALMRNTIDLKRANLILRALHIAVKNAARVHYKIYSKESVTEIPEYAQPAAEETHERTSLDLPYTAEVPYVEPTAHDRLLAAKAAEEAACRAQIRAQLERAAISHTEPLCPEPGPSAQSTATAKPGSTLNKKAPTNVKPTPPNKANGATAG